MSKAEESILVEDNHDSVLRVGNTSNPKDVASALSHALYDRKRVTIRAIGAGAVNQAVKALAIARGFVAPRGLNIAFIPGFDSTIMPDGKEVSVITFRVVQTDQ